MAERKKFVKVLVSIDGRMHKQLREEAKRRTEKEGEFFSVNRLIRLLLAKSL